MTRRDSVIPPRVATCNIRPRALDKIKSPHVTFIVRTSSFVGKLLLSMYFHLIMSQIEKCIYIFDNNRIAILGGFGLNLLMLIFVRDKYIIHLSLAFY